MAVIIKKSCRPVFFSTLVFFDSETTGLPSVNFKPEITELCMLALSRFHLEIADSHLRVQNQLKLCFNPTRTISSIASKISGLSADNLFHQKDFDTSAVDLIQLFINRLDPPICLIAQNGFNFDIPLLKAQIFGVKGPDYRFLDNSGGPIYCSDTLYMFRNFSNELSGSNNLSDSGNISMDEKDTKQPLSHSSPVKTVTNKLSFSLGDVFARVFGSSHDDAHSAEGDCRAMLRLVQYLDSSAIDWLQSNYVLFDDISPMYDLRTATSYHLHTGFPFLKKDNKK